MSTMIIVLLAVVIIYLFYAIFGGKSGGEAAAPAPAKTSAKAKATAKPKQQSKPKQKEVASGKVSADEEITTLSNPKTGDEAPVPNNYRFAKRWIKEALVEEGLLSKIYKNNELDDAANKKVKGALEKLTAIKKYQA
ncbi:MAG: hypothetical protein V3V31_06080 [Methylococcales bacterium]